MIRKHIVSAILAILVAMLIGIQSIGVARADGTSTPTPTPTVSTDSGVSGGENGGG